MRLSGIIRDWFDKMRCAVFSGITSEGGQTLVEYALLLLLVALVVIFMLTGLGTTVNNTYSKINTSIPT